MTAHELTGTKLELVQAALEALRRSGFHGASAREIASVGGFNQALIFYHFGSVRNLLLAALDLVSARRMPAYGPAFCAGAHGPRAGRAWPARSTPPISSRDT